jgi:hypothetical protein
VGKYIFENVHLREAWKIGLEISLWNIILLHLDQDDGRNLNFDNASPKVTYNWQEVLTDLQIYEPLNVSNSQYAVVP